MSLTAATDFETALAPCGELLAKYQTFLATVNGTERLPKRVLALCEARIRAIHGIESDDAGETDPADVTPEERAALAVAERIPFQHHQLEDAEVQEVTTAFGPGGAVALLTYLAFVDASCRLSLTFGR